MPRKGRGTQPAAEFPSPGYGQGEELAELQRQVPLPQDRDMQGATAPQAALEPVDPFALARDNVSPTGLPPNAPTTRPTVPVTNGLSAGPGAGPEARRNRPKRRNPSADTVRFLAEITGDPVLANRASKIREF